MKTNLEDGAAGRSRRGRRVIAVLLLGFFLLAAVAWWCFDRFADNLIEAKKVRTLVAAKTGREIGGEAGLQPLAARGFHVSSAGLLVTAAPPRALTELRAADIDATFSLLELWRGKLRIERLSARHVQAAYGAEAARLLDRKEFAAPKMVPPSQSESPLSVDIREVAIARADLFWADPQKDGGQIREVAATCYPDGKDLIAHGRGGTFQQAKWPETRIVDFKLFYSKPKLRIDEARLALGERGTIQATGNFQFEQTASLDLQLQFEHCPIAPFLKKHADKIGGNVAGQAHLQKQIGATDSLLADGSVHLEEAVLQKVAALQKAAAFTGQAQLDPLHLDEVRGDFRWENEQLAVRQFRAVANRVLSVRGNFTYRDGEIDGTFQVGVAPEIVAKFPGAREEVFTRAEDDYLWTAVKVSGPLDHPRDDLKPRLLAALEKHVAFGFLAPLLKTGQAARTVIDLLLPE